MSTTVHNPTLNRARNILNVFSLSRVKIPDPTLARGTHEQEAAIHREISIISRLGRLPAEDQRRGMIRHSIFEADRQFKQLIAVVQSRLTETDDPFARDESVVSALKSLGNTPIGIKKQFAQLNTRCNPPEALALWIQRIVASRELLHDAVVLDAGETESQLASFARRITFEAEYRQAGISVLSYFGEIIRLKYPESAVRVSIEQKGSTVTLVIETETGAIDRIERELTQYGLVVAGRLPATELLSDPIEAMRLQHKLDMAQLEVRHTRDLLRSEQSRSEENITSMKSEIAFIRRVLDKAQYESSMNSEAIRALAATNAAVSVQALDRIAKLVESPEEARIADLQLQLREIHLSSPGILDSINELLVKGSIQGAAGNFLYAALQAIQRLV